MISWKLAILVLIIVPLKLLFVHFFSKKKETVIKQWIEEMTSFSACFDDTINGIREVKLWNMYKSCLLYTSCLPERILQPCICHSQKRRVPWRETARGDLEAEGKCHFRAG